MKAKTRTTSYIVPSIAVALLLLTAQISMAGSATWLLSPQDSAWENANNWTPGGPPNGPSDIATFTQSSQTNVNISIPEEVNSIVFTSGSASFTLNISPGAPPIGGELIISGTGVSNNGSGLKTFGVGATGQIIFNNSARGASAQMRIFNGSGFYTSQAGGQTIFNDASSAGGISIGNSSAELGEGGIGRTIFKGGSTADHAYITNYGAYGSHGTGGQTIFNDTSTAANASIDNMGSNSYASNGGYTVFNDTSTAGHAVITSHEGGVDAAGQTIFNDKSTADSAMLIANGGSDYYNSGVIVFNGASTGGSARVKVFGNGYLDISRHQSGVTIGSLDGSGNVYLGANNLRVGTNNINTAFSGVISGNASLTKVGSGVLTLQANDCITDTVGLALVSGSVIRLDFAGAPDIIASLKINGVPQSPGVYGSITSGAPNSLPEFAGPGTVRVTGPVGSRLGNISTRAFVQTGNNVVIGGFIVKGAQTKRVIIRAIGPELSQYGIPDPLYNPTLELHDRNGALIASNDNWVTTIIGGIITGNQVREIQNSGYAPGDGRESAIIADLPPGNYTAIVRGVDNMTGVSLVEVYDLSDNASSILGNISTRAFVQMGDNVMVGGFIVQGPPKRVIIRAIGPELGAPPYNIPNALADPTLELHDRTGALIASNDNWMDTILGGIIHYPQVRDIRDSGRAPRNWRESAIIAELPAGNYTAIMRGVNNTTGVALVEVYDLDQ